MGKEKKKGTMEYKKEERERDTVKGVFMAAVWEVKWLFWYWWQ